MSVGQSNMIVTIIGVTTMDSKSSSNGRNSMIDKDEILDDDDEVSNCNISFPLSNQTTPNGTKLSRRINKYILEVYDKSTRESWRIQHRFSEFLKLREKIKTEVTGIKLPKIRTKLYLINTSSLVNKRILLLTSFINELLNILGDESESLNSFLGNDDSGALRATSLYRREDMSISNEGNSEVAADDEDDDEDDDPTDENTFTTTTRLTLTKILSNFVPLNSITSSQNEPIHHSNQHPAPEMETFMMSPQKSLFIQLTVLISLLFTSIIVRIYFVIIPEAFQTFAINNHSLLERQLKLLFLFFIATGNVCLMVFPWTRRVYCTMSLFISLTSAVMVYSMRITFEQCLQWFAFNLLSYNDPIPLNIFPSTLSIYNTTTLIHTPLTPTSSWIMNLTLPVLNLFKFAIEMSCFELLCLIENSYSIWKCHENRIYLILTTAVFFCLSFYRIIMNPVHRKYFRFIVVVLFLTSMMYHMMFKSSYIYLYFAFIIGYSFLRNIVKKKP